MKGFLATILFIFSSLIALQAQDLYFTPNWEKGDVKTITLHRTDIEMQADTMHGKLVSEVSYKVQVAEKSKKYFTLVMLDEEGKLEKLLDDGADEFEISCRVNRKTGALSFPNWRVVNTVEEKIAKMERVVEEEGSGEGELVASYITDLFEPYRTKKGYEQYIKRHIGFLFEPFYRYYSLEDTIVIERKDQLALDDPVFEIISNPVDMIDSIRVKAVSPISYQIEKVTNVDFSSALKEVVKYAEELLKAEGLPKLSKEKKAEIMDFGMDYRSASQYSYNTSSRWISTMTKVEHISVSEPSKKGSSYTVTTTITVD